MASPLEADFLLRAVETAAVLAFALSGLIEAIRKRMDVVGVCSVAFVTAFGGGTLRDVLLDQRPFFWVANPGWVWAVLALSLLAAAGWRGHHLRPTQRLIRLPDALGLGLFSVVGTSQAHALGMPAVVAVLMGVVTAVFGGVLRDVLCNQIPAVFRDHRPYAVCSFAGGWVWLGAQALGWPPIASLLAGAATATGLRWLALVRGWQVPGWRADPSE